MMKRGNLLIAAGILMISAAIAFICYNLWDDRRAGEATDKVCEELSAVIPDDPVPAGGRASDDGDTSSKNQALTSEIEYPDYILNPQMDMPVESVDGRDYIGILDIPAIDRSLPVIADWNYPNLRVAPCRYTGSAYLDSMVICAHNYDKHFGGLKSLSYDEEVRFTDIDGNVFTYQVAEITTMPPTAIEEMTDAGYDLTLFTCTIGGATRVAVRCMRKEQ